ncbi:MAG: aminoglycoside phosphotransferase family protein [Reyranella sp.]|nr:aminoglycoside phosphotransferase family protein [Reyranella sp.]
MTPDLPDVAKPERLTDALRRHGVLSAGRVRDITTDAPRDTLLSRIVRLKLAYEGPTEKAPGSLILKTWRPRDGVPEAWAAREVLFYDTVAPATPAGPLLRCFDAGQSPQTKAWHLLLEDVTDSHCIAAEWPLPPTEPQCRAIVGVLARFHAAWWGAAQAEPAMAMARDLYQGLPGFWANLSDRLGDRLSADRRRIYERFFAAPPHFARLATRKNLSIVHGDAHVWNVFLPNDGSVGGERLFDWSVWQPGLPTADLACMMAMHWYPERRRRFERPLLDHYHASLLASGVEGYDRAMLDQDYRLAVLTQMMTPIVWANIGIPPSVWWNNFERIMLAVDDLGCRDLLSP